jgi:polyhydroxyalkanoate synthesis regulator phasin
MDDDFEKRFDAISVPELRRRVDLAVGYVREMRRALAVQVGMAIENVPGPVPEIDAEQGKRIFEELMEMLPLLQRRLTPEERAGLRTTTSADRQRMREAVDELAESPEAFDAVMEEAEADVRHADVEKLRESFEKTDMLGEVLREVQALAAEMQGHKERLAAQRDALAERILRGMGR